MKSPITLACLALLAVPALAADPWQKRHEGPDLLPVETAFQLDGVSRDGNALRVSWTIAPGYYLYRQRLAFEPVDSPAKLGAAELPKGVAVHDEHYGQVEIYRDSLSARLPAAGKSGLPSRLRVRYQGCADAGVCYPPVTRIVDVAAP